MYAATSWSEAPPAGIGLAGGVAAVGLPRAEGRLEVAFRQRHGRTVLARLHQQGSAKARLPRPIGDAAPELVTINLAGGITGGDRLTQTIEWGAGTHAIATTQAAEKIYRASLGAPSAELRHRLIIGAHATAEWLPQETILFDGAKLHRRLAIELAGDARLIAAEAIVFGRAAMGETVRYGFLQDDWRIRIDGRLVFADGLRFDGPVQAVLDRPAVTRGGRALATVLYVGQETEALLLPARAAMAGLQGHAAVSRLGSVLVARLIAADGMMLRRMVVAYLDALRMALELPSGLPKLWHC